MTKLPPVPKPPHCRYCGGLIRKETTRVYFKPEASKFDNTSLGSAYSYGPYPQTREEAQQRTNGQIVSVSRRIEHSYVGNESVPTDVGIDHVTVWDGSTYVDPFFCNGDHAKRFAYVMARAGLKTEAYALATKEENTNGRT